MGFLWFKTKKEKQAEDDANWYKEVEADSKQDWRLFMAVASDRGSVRPNNEDNFLMDSICNEKQAGQYYYEDSQCLNQCRVAAVFDGMGGESSGELASLTAAKMMGTAASNQRNTDLKAFVKTIKNSFGTINNRIIEYQNEQNTVIGTTAVVLCTDGTEFQVMNCGDSRAYLFRDGRISCLTKDHTLAADRIAQGLYRADSKEARRDKHSLTCFLGIDTQMIGLVPDETGWYDFENDDILLLCSDGLTDACSSKDMEHILKEKSSLKDKANELLKTALRQGSKDNITCLLVKKAKHTETDRGTFAYGED